MTKKQLRRGFKTEAEEYAREFRLELGLRDDAPLPPKKLAEHLAIPLVPLSQFRAEIPEAVRFFFGEGRSAFSAVTIFGESKRLVIYNDSHSPGRQASDLSHELAHGILAHPPCPPLSENGCRSFDPVLEAEADWLGGTLLVPRPAAFRIARRGTPLPDAAVEYGVSQPLMRMRLNVTGVYRQVNRVQARRTGTGVIGRTY